MHENFLKNIVKMYELNDGNGRWLPFGLRKQLYYTIIKYNPEYKGIIYNIKDHV